MARSWPDLTVIVPVWDDYARFIPDVIDNLRSEGIACEQIVIVDNASCVPVPPIAGTRRVRLDARVSIGAARNAGCAHVRTRWVMFADADDLLVAGAIDVLRAGASADAVLVAGRPELDNGELYSWPPQWAFQMMSRRRRAAAQWAWNHLPLSTGSVLATEAVRELGGFPDVDLAEDGMLGCLLACAGVCVLVDHPTRVYRTHAEGLCQRGHPARRWRAAYRQQRQLIAGHRALGPIRYLAHAYAPVHAVLARRLARDARHRERP